MNAIFSINRLSALVRKEIREKYPIILRLTIISLCCYIIFWLLSILMEQSPSVITRGSTVSFLFMIMTFLTPYILYKRENQHLAGTFYAISPVSTLEKILSVFILCTILTPVIIFLSVHALDSLLTLFSSGAYGFHGNIWAGIGDVNHFNIPECVDEVLVPNGYLGTLASQGIYVFLCMLFRRNKLGYSILLNIVAGIIGLVFAIVYFSHGLSAGWTEQNFDSDRIIRFANIWIVTGYYVIPAVCWILTYLRIKRIQY